MSLTPRLSGVDKMHVEISTPSGVSLRFHIKSCLCTAWYTMQPSQLVVVVALKKVGAVYAD